MSHVCRKQPAKRSNAKRGDDSSAHKGAESAACDSSCRSPPRGSEGCSEGQGASEKGDRESPPHAPQSTAATKKNAGRAAQGAQGRKLGLAPPYNPAQEREKERQGEGKDEGEGQQGSTANSEAERKAPITGEGSPTKTVRKVGSARRREPPAGNLWSAGPVETRARYPFLQEWQREMKQALKELLSSRNDTLLTAGGEEGIEPAAGAATLVTKEMEDAGKPMEGEAPVPVGEEKQGHHQTPQDPQAPQEPGCFDERSGVFTTSRPAFTEGSGVGGERARAVLSVDRQASLLSVLLGNILRNPHEPKFRIFRPSQSSTFAALWQGCPLSKQLLKKLGFVEVKSKKAGKQGETENGQGKAGKQGGEVEEAAGDGEGGEGSMVVLWKVTEAHLEVMRGLVDRLEEYLPVQAPPASPALGVEGVSERGGEGGLWRGASMQGAEGGSWRVGWRRKSAPVPRDRAPGRGPWG